MLVCHCKVVDDRTIRAAVADGAGDLDGVIERCGAGGACGGCIPGVRALLEQAAMALRDPAALATAQASHRCEHQRAACDRVEAAGRVSSPA